MKILIATPYYLPAVGGLENYAAAIASGLHGLGWEVVVVCGDTSVRMMTKENMSGYTVYRLPIWKVVSNTPIHLSWFGMLKQIIRNEKPDVINAHTPVPYMVDMVTLAAGKVPVVVTYHAATLLKPGSLTMKVLTAVYQLVQAITLSRVREIIAVSPYVKEALGKRLADKTWVVPNAVAEVASSVSAHGKGLVFVANLEPTHVWKGLDLILDSLVIAREKYGITPPLTVIGDGADRARYENRVRMLDLETSVSFRGKLVGKARDAVVREAAAMVIYPSTANDAAPTVLLEGWAQGLPVIAGAIGPIPSLVADNETGILVKPNSPADLALAIHKLLDTPDDARAMGETARRLVETEYLWPRQVDRTAKLFEAVK